MKKLAALILALTLLLSLCPVTVFAQSTVIASGSLNMQMHWSLTSDGVLTISGNGAMPTLTQNPWIGYRSQIKTVVVEHLVTSLDAAFEQCTELTSVSLPSTLVTIGDAAFYGCTSLESIVIPDSVTTIGNMAFSGCSSLSDVTLGSKVATLGELAFSSCAITEIDLPASLTTINAHAFYCCRQLESVVMPESVTTIADGAFADCSKLTEVTIPGGIVSTASSVLPFSGCDAVTDITYTGTSAQWNTLAPTLFTTAQLSDASVTCTGFAALGSGTLTDTLFWGISGEGTLVIRGTGAMPYYSSETEVPWYALRQSIHAIVVEEGVTAIGHYAFYDCSAATAVSLPTTLTSIGSYAFKYCAALTSITVPDKVTSLGLDAFSYCTQLASVSLPDTMASIGSSAFYSCSSLTSIEIPTGITQLPNNTFNRCSQLTSITIPEGVTKLGRTVFGECTALTAVTLPSTLAEYTVEYGYIPFNNCNLIRNITYNGTEAMWTEYELLNMFNGKVREKATIHYANAVTYHTLPDKVVYAKGEALDLTGLTVTAFGSENNIASSVTAAGFDPNTVGKQTVTLTCNGVDKTYDVYVFGFTGLSLTLEGKIDVNVYGTFPGAEELYEAGVLFFNEKPSADMITAALAADRLVTGTTHDENSLRFVYDDVAAKEMNDLIYIVPVAKLPDGTAVIGKTSSTSPAQYVSSAFDTYEDARLRTMLVDMLNYGAAAQQHFNYRTDALANANLTTAQKALGTKDTPVINSCTAVYRDVLSDASISLQGASLTLENELSVNVYAALSAPSSDAELLAFDSYRDGSTYDETTAVSSSALSQNGSSYVGSLTNIPVKLVRKPLYVRMHSGDAYSDVLRYSVETYAYTVLNGDYPAALKNLADQLMRYGDSAAAYFGILPEPPAVTHTVSFDVGDGELPANTQTVVSVQDGACLADLPLPMPPNGHKFSGWYNGETLFTTDTPVTSDITLTAKYELNALVVTFDAGDGQWPDALENPAYVMDQATMTLPEPIAPEGYNFIGWFDGETQYTDETPFTAHVTLTAKYEPETLNLQDENFTIVAGELIAYTGSSAEVVVPNGVTKVTAGAFKNNKIITSVTLPATVSSIQAYAFDTCSKLTTVNIPAGVTRIEEYTFNNCAKLSAISFPATLEYIGSYAFYNCDALTTLTLNEGLTEMDDYAFQDCDGLTTVTLPTTLKTLETVFRYSSCLTTVCWAEGLESIGSGAFESTALNGNIVFPTTLKYVSSRAFYDTDITSITFHSKVEQISDYAFYSNTNLQSVQFIGNRTLHTIGKYAFAQTRLSTITLPSSLLSIGEKAFTGYTVKFSPYPSIAVFCAATIPPTISADTFSSIYTTASSAGGYTTRDFTLYVPASALEAYEGAPYWKNASNISAYTFS